MVSEIQDFSYKRVDRYLLTILLGTGAASSVYQAIDTTLVDSPVLAIKCMPKSRCPKTFSQQIAEISNHKAVFGCPNVMPLSNVVEEAGYFFLVFPLCEMDMFRAIWKERVYWRNDLLIKKAFVEILDGVLACHRKGIYHRDIKPENIMCSSGGLNIKVCDFGLSTDCRVARDGGCGTIPYMSPESWDNQAVLSFSESMDIWSLGVTLFNMVTGYYPWEEARPKDKDYRAFLCNANHLMKSHPISQSFNALLFEILHPSPSARLTIPAIRKVVLEMDTFYNLPHPSTIVVPLLHKERMLVDSQLTCVASDQFEPKDDKKRGYIELHRLTTDVLPKVPCID